MTHYRAAIVAKSGGNLEVMDMGIQEPGPGEVLIRNYAVAVQPLDAKMLIASYGPAAQFHYPAVLGSSGAGIVEQLGDGVTELKVGEKVVFDTKAYVEPSTNRKQGTWQQLVVSSVATVAKIGDVAFEDAVLTNFPLQTAVAVLHVFLGMEKPDSARSEDKVLIWGAGGAVGSYGVQYARSAGYTVVVTASPRDFDRQKELGAAEVVDYKAPDAVDQLRKLGPYRYLFTASGDPTSQQALAALLPEGGRFASVLPGSVDIPANVEIVYTAFSQAAQKDDYKSWRDWWYGSYLPDVLTKRAVATVKYVKVEGGLTSLQQASQDVFDGKVRGKLVINPQE